MIAYALKLTIEENEPTGFTDEKNIPSWAKGVAAAMKRLGIMQRQVANRFDSDAKATRAEAATILLRMLEQQNK
ncbi:S-layer homology domain-containing protein [Paenibacillus paeoniae]|nr:S-layer homology domain-containing protein [Paenibacillus paeoniae]